MAKREVTPKIIEVNTTDKKTGGEINYPDFLKKHNIVAVIPTYNEERFIGSVVLKAKEYTPSVVVIDDGSSDKTRQIAERAGAIVIHHDVNCGKGAALNSGFQKARELNADIVVLLDGDGQHRPDDIPNMIKPIINDGVDMVIGSRYLGLDSDIPGYRVFGQKVITSMTNLASGITSTDSWSGFRAFSKRALDCMSFREGGWGVDPEFQFQAKEHSFKVSEVPIVTLYEERAKRNPLPHAYQTINAIIRMVSQHRPLLYFGIMGSVLLLVGLIIGVWVYDRFRIVHQLATGTAIISIMCVILGIVSMFTGIILNSIRSMVYEIKQSIQKG